MLRKLPAVFITLLLSINAYSQQPPNGTFETWTDSLPNSWETNNSGDSLVPIVPTADMHSGSLALRGDVFDFHGGHVPPSFKSASVSGLGTPILNRYVALTGWYKAELVGTNYITIQITIFAGNGLSIGIGYEHFPAVANYTRFYLPVGYTNNSPARFVKIEVNMADTSGLGFNLGSYYIMDDFNLELVSGVGQVNTPSFTVGPIPSNDHLNISGNFLNGQIYEACIFDATGKLALKKSFTSNANGLPPIDVSILPEGTYLLFLVDSNQGTSSQKIIISR